MFVLSPCLYTGITLAVFRQSGKIPDSNKLNKIFRGVASTSAAKIKNLEDISSGPKKLLFLREFICCITSYLVQGEINNEEILEVDRNFK